MACEVGRLKAMTGLSTVDLFRHAFALYRTVMDARNSGKQIAEFDPKCPDNLTLIEFVGF
jgi:hypothetical protein